MLRWAALGLALLSPSGAMAADKAAGWASVTRIQGTLTIEFTHWNRESDRKGDSRETAEVRFKMVRDPSVDLPGVVWRAESAKATGAWRASTSDVAGTSTTTADFSGTAAGLSDFTLSLDTETGAWQLVSPGFINEKYEVQIKYSADRMTGEGPRTDVMEQNTIQSGVFEGVVSGQPGATSGKFEVAQTEKDKPGSGSRSIGRIQFSPEFDDFELEITIADYQKWRPRGSISAPTSPGNNLLVRATVKPKPGGQTPPAVDTIKFSLLDTSREPGVCLNWPLDAQDKEFDIRLAATPLFPGTLGDQGQSLNIKQLQRDPESRPYAEAQLDSYDFGGKAELRVVALLPDGREIVGKMKYGGTETDLVRIPRRLGPDWIAAAWREAHKVEKLPEDDDDESVEGQEYKGDGFTLYEEYRGWAVGGQHVEGDPKAKDFFVQNRIGADAEPGIDLFAKLSKLRVHSKLLRKEMSQSTRLMNGNHFNAPQRVQQHGVWIKKFSKKDLGDDGAATVMLKAGVVGRPGLVKGIGILARKDPESAFNKPFNMPVQDLSFAYDRALAHELLHSVGVEHHGKGDYSKELYYIPQGHRNNRLGKPYYSSAMLGQEPVELKDETGQDVAALNTKNFKDTLEFLRSVHGERLLAEGRSVVVPGRNNPSWADTPEKYVESSLVDLATPYLTIRGTVGAEHGEHSGQQDSVMRYSFATFYERKGSAGKSLYLVTPGTERIGRELSRSTQGTGINAQDHKPQSRYGDASSGLGDSFGPICPNDAIPPKAAK